jgi:hypothetical protein
LSLVIGLKYTSSDVGIDFLNLIPEQFLLHKVKKLQSVWNVCDWPGFGLMISNFTGFVEVASE